MGDNYHPGAGKQENAKEQFFGDIDSDNGYLYCLFDIKNYNT